MEPAGSRQRGSLSARRCSALLAGAGTPRWAGRRAGPPLWRAAGAARNRAGATARCWAEPARRGAAVELEKGEATVASVASSGAGFSSWKCLVFFFQSN